MGFGTKVDPTTGASLNLDATYQEIIKPAAEQAGFKCIRADDISHSGVIDVQMYKMLLNAALVIADITTNNANALYELGVRHAFRQKNTIIMSEESGVLHFDLNHTITMKYRHDGRDIGCSEARRAKAALIDLIEGALQIEEPDSPVYTFLPKLKMPYISEEEKEIIIDEAEATEDKWIDLTNSIEEALKQDKFKTAINHIQKALQLKNKDHYLIQRLALATYKSEYPTQTEALMNALDILSDINYKQSNDTESTGLAGAIYKRLWQVSKNIEFLDLAIRYYTRGFSIKKDYYNGENLAWCYDEKKQNISDANEKIYCEISAKKIRLEVKSILEDLVRLDFFDDRSDKKWVYGSLANVNFYLDELEEGNKYESLFLENADAEWEKKTYFASKRTGNPAINNRS